jgi:hypothetical protein
LPFILASAFQTKVSGLRLVERMDLCFGLQTNDLFLQLRKRRISKIILSGMVENMRENPFR